MGQRAQDTGFSRAGIGPASLRRHCEGRYVPGLNPSRFIGCDSDCFVAQ